MNLKALTPLVAQLIAVVVGLLAAFGVKVDPELVHGIEELVIQALGLLVLASALLPSLASAWKKYKEEKDGNSF